MISVLTQTGNAYGLVERVKEAHFAQGPNGSGVTLVDNPLIDVRGARGRVLNTSTVIQALLKDQTSISALNKILKLSDEPTVSTIYAMFDGKQFSRFLEVSHSDRMMGGDVGVRVGFAMGLGLVPPEDPFECVNNLDLIRGFLEGADYHGEIGIGLDDRYMPTTVMTTHFPHFFAMYSELCDEGPLGMLQFAAQTGDGKVTLKDAAVLANLVSVHPYPIINDAIESRINAERESEHHLWRVRFHNQEVVIVLAQTSRDSFRRLRSRIFRTIDAMKAFDDTLQYRVDCGYRLKFALSKKKYKGLLQRNEAYQSTKREARKEEP